MTKQTAETPGPALRDVTRAVVISQMLFTAGHSLTTGGFLYYFLNEFPRFRESALLLALAQVAPETSEALSLVARHVIALFHTRKWIWVGGLLLGRLISCLIPLSLLLEPDSQAGVLLVLAAIVGWHLCQGISYCAYVSWLSELVPSMNWGRFFAKRRIAGLVISIIVPISAGLLRREYLQNPELAAHWRQLSYAIIFGAGALLVMGSVLPLLKLPDLRPVLLSFSRSEGTPQETIQRRLSPNFRWLLASRWWLSFFQGMTQAVIFKFSTQVLKIELTDYYQLYAFMLSVQIVTAWLAGRWCDRGRDWQVLFWSMLGVSGAMGFWCLATPDARWLVIGAYLLWGGFGFVNVALQNLTLKLAPVSDNALQISLSRQFSGLIAGGAGILGGFWLDRLLADQNWSLLQSYQLLFLVSWIGRATAPLWLLPIRQQQPSEQQRAME